MGGWAPFSSTWMKEERTKFNRTPTVTREIEPACPSDMRTTNNPTEFVGRLETGAGTARLVLTVSATQDSAAPILDHKLFFSLSLSLSNFSKEHLDVSAPATKRGKRRWPTLIDSN
jgi:hypothetical protein